MALTDWLGSAVDGILGLFGLGNSAENRKLQEKMNQINLDYAKAMTEKQWERDDTTYQRSVADAIAAGFSPLAVLDGGLSPNGSPLGYQGQAPQFDINGVLNAALAASSKLQESSENEKNRQAEYKKIQDTFNNEVELLTKTYDNLETQAQKDFVRQIELLEETNKMNHETDKYKETIREAEQLGAIILTPSSDYNLVKKENQKTMNAYNEYMRNYKNQTTKTADSETATAGIGTGKLPGANVEGSITTNSETTSQAITYAEYAQSFWSDNVWYYYEPSYKGNKNVSEN